jgi:hypothetical protein
MSAYVSIRQHTASPARAAASACTHTSAYVSIRQHTSAHVSIRRRRQEPPPAPARPPSLISICTFVLAAAGARERVRTFNLRVRQYLYFCTSKASKLRSQARESACIRSTRGCARVALFNLLALPAVYLLYWLLQTLEE